jgi:septum site-determining protein MinC
MMNMEEVHYVINSQSKPLVRIKGVKEGLYFILDDSSDWQLVLDELEYKLMKSHQNILSGPVMDVFVKLGQREVTEEIKLEISTLIQYHENLHIKSIQSSTTSFTESPIVTPQIQLVKSVIRSGQILQYNSDVLFLGDVNPGGSIVSTGDIYVMGSLRGIAHAGKNGKRSAMIMASYLKPTQLRIADLICRPPDDSRKEDYYMECAYVHEGRMEIEKIQQLHHLLADRNFTHWQTTNS